MNKIDKYEHPYTYLKNIVENVKIGENFINSLFKTNIKTRDLIFVLEFIKKDGYDVSSFKAFDSFYTTDDELYILFKNMDKGYEFIVLYQVDTIWCQFGYFTEKGEVFSFEITIKDCIGHYDPKHCYAPDW